MKINRISRRIFLIVILMLVLVMPTIAFINGFPQFYRNDVQIVQEGKNIIIKDALLECGFKGISMAPTITPDDCVVLQDVLAHQIKEGMIVKYYNEELNSYIVHRVASVYDHKIITCGDNNKECEDIQRSQIKHKVVGVIHK